MNFLLTASREHTKLDPNPIPCAMRTVVRSPTGSFIRRGFSIHGSIYNNTWIRLEREKVGMLRFPRCSFNMMGNNAKAQPNGVLFLTTLM